MFSEIITYNGKYNKNRQHIFRAGRDTFFRLPTPTLRPPTSTSDSIDFYTVPTLSGDIEKKSVFKGKISTKKKHIS